MRVGLLIYGSPDTLTGGYLYDRLLVRELRRLGDEVEIVSLPWRGYGRHLVDNFSTTLRRRLLNANFDVLIQDELNHPSVVGLNRWLKTRVSSRNKLTQRRRGAEVTAVRNVFSFIRRCALGHGVSYPIVSLIHLLRHTEPRPAWQNGVYRQIERLYLASVDGCIYNSHDSRRLVERLVSPMPGVVAYPGKDHLTLATTPAQIAARAQESGPLRLVYVGNVVGRKGLDVLLQALLRWPHENWRLTVIGSLTMDPQYAARVRALTAKAGWGENVRWLGAVANENLGRFLRQSQVFVLPSRYEGFGIVYLEALGAGLPVIATTAGAAGELVSHGENGFLVSPGETADLRNHLRTLHRNRDQLVHLGTNAYRRWQQHPTWAQTAKTIREFYQGLAIGECARHPQSPISSLQSPHA